MKILHVFFSSVIKPQHKFLGTTKDIRGRTQYFLERGIDCEELILKIRKEKFFLRGIKDFNLSKFDAVMVEGMYYPITLRQIKKSHPSLRVLMRAINAELLHWLHSALAAALFDSPKRVLLDIKGAVKFGLSDIRCARLTDYVLPIAEWETQRYWSWLAPKERLITMPYFLPDSYLKAIPPSRAKKPQCVCMMTTKAGRPFLADAARSLFRLVRKLGEDEPEWRFFITGDFSAKRLLPCPRVEVTGFLENPLELLAESRAVALLSDYGFGFKTKLLEAICSGCFLLVKKQLYSRLPSQVQRFCLVVDVHSVQSFRDALTRCLGPFPQEDANGPLREAAYAALDKALGLTAVPKTPAQPELSSSAG